MEGLISTGLPHLVFSSSSLELIQNYHTQNIYPSCRQLPGNYIPSPKQLSGSKFHYLLMFLFGNGVSSIRQQVPQGKMFLNLASAIRARFLCNMNMQELIFCTFIETVNCLQKTSLLKSKQMLHQLLPAKLKW